MRLFNFITITCLVAGAVYVQAQDIYSKGHVPIASPTAASLGKYADHPVSYHTGVAEISIPLYTIEAGPLKLPMSLSYHPSGLKVMEQASWVGAGWALNAGGVITRTINGKPDEKPSADGSETAVGYFQNKGYYSYLHNSAGVLDYLNFARGYKDGEPDLFFFNFNGHSGKFYFRADTTVALVPQQDLHIKPLFHDDNTGVDYLYGWIVTTPDGIRYYFGKTLDVSGDTDAVEHTRPYSFNDGQNSTKVVSSWYLYKVESPDRKFSIGLAYTPEEYSFHAVSLFPVPIPVSTGNSSGVALVKNMMNGVRLNTITFPTGMVSFIPEATPREDLSSNIGGPTDYDNVNARALKEIQISDGTFCKAFAFSYSYFVNSSPLKGTFGGLTGLETSYNIHTDKKRLKLGSLTERSCDNAEAKPPHIFTYYDEASVPRTLSFAQDHWGFYNGEAQNSELIPSLSDDGGWNFVKGLHANRESRWPAMRAGALQKIQYPTGGYSEFTYGHHHVQVNEIVHSSRQACPDVTARGNALPYTTSEKHTIVVNKTTAFRVSMRAFPTQGGNGTVYLGPGLSWNISRNGGVYNDPHYYDWVSYTFVVQPGTYVFYCSVGGGLASNQGIEANLTELTQYTQTDDRVVGGLRIESITHGDGLISGILTTTYNYNHTDGTPQGVLYSRPHYISLLRNDQMRDAAFNNGCVEVGTDHKLGYYVSPSSIHPMRSTQGYHFGYNQVKVTQSDGGYTVYQYRPSINESGDVSIRSIDSYVCDPSAPNYPPHPQPYDFERGELQRESAYNASSILLKETQYSNEYMTEEIGVTGLLVKQFNGFLPATEYEMKTVKKTKSTTLTLSYDGSNSGLPPTGTLSETVFNSPYHHLATRTTQWEVAGGTKLSDVVKGKMLSETRNIRVGDVVIPSCNAAYTCDEVTRASIMHAMINFNSAQLGCGSDTECKRNAWHTYIRTVNNARINYVSCRISYRTNYNSCITGAYTGSDVNLKALLNLQYRHQVGSVIETSVWRNNQFLNSSFTSYRDFGNDRRSIYPGGLETINTASPQAGYTPFSNTDTSVTKDVAYKKEETYRYEHGNMVEETNKHGITTVYLWGYNNSLPVVRAVGVSYAVLKSAYDAVNGDPGSLRSRPELNGALITTYTYSPLTGMASQTDPNGNTTTYVYDKLGRLQYTKDKDSNIVEKIEYNYKTN